MLSWLNYATFFGLGLTAYPLLPGQLYIYGCICFLSFYSGVVVGPVRRHYFWRFPERIRDRRTVGSVLRVVGIFMITSTSLNVNELLSDICVIADTPTPLIIPQSLYYPTAQCNLLSHFCYFAVLHVAPSLEYTPLLSNTFEHLIPQCDIACCVLQLTSSDPRKYH